MYLEEKIGKENQLIAQFQKHRYMQSLSLQIKDEVSDQI
jgi:hypothetical protein